MKKRIRILALILSLTVILSYIPAIAFAEDSLQPDADKSTGDAYSQNDANYTDSKKVTDKGEDVLCSANDDSALQDISVNDDPDAIEVKGEPEDKTYEENIDDAASSRSGKKSKVLLAAGDGTAEEGEEPAAGPVYELNDGVLIISGEGAVENELYKGNKEITELIVEEGITSIGASAFANCTSLQSVSFPLSLTQIGETAFSGCTSLEVLNLTEGITNIAAGAFKGDTALREVYIPLSVQTGSVTYTYNESSYKAWGIFEGCKNLTTVTYEEGTEHIHSGMFAGSGLKEVVLPDTVTGIGKYAFANCTSLENIVFPEGLTEISDYAFSACTALKTLDLTGNITTIGPGAFRNATALTDVYIPLSVQTGAITYSYNNDNKKAWGIFEGCKNLTNITYEEGTEYIHAGLFAGSGIKEVVLPDTVKSINNYAFASCGSLTSVDLDGIENVKNYAFASCTALSALEIPDSLTTIGEYAFYGCKSIPALQITDTVTNIGKGAFGACTGLKDLSLSAAFMNSGDYIYSYNTSSYKAWGLFDGCSSLSNVAIEEGTTRIPAGFFAGSGITEIELPGTLKTIYPFAFSNTALKKITIPDTVTTLGYCAFSMSTSLEEVNLSKNWSTCPSFEGSTGSIFRGCTALLLMAIPDGMETIPEYAFADCDSLIYISIPDSVKTIGKYAFYNCNALTSIAIPEGVDKLPESAFNNCTKLYAVNIPKSVKTVEPNAFNNCTGISEVNYAGSDADWKDIGISESGNSVANDFVINYDFKVTYTTKDFKGVWEGEYDGNSDDQVVRRHFVLMVNDCTVKKGDLAEISGTRTISQSIENPSSLYAEGSDEFRGVVNLKTGAMSFQGYEWIAYPVGEETYSNFNHISYTGIIEADKKSMRGYNGNLLSRTYHAEKLVGGKQSATTVVMSMDQTSYDLLSDPVDILAGSETVATIIVKPDWMGNQAGKIRLFQKDIAVESKTGVFIDIKPGTIFKPDSTIFVALVDANDNVVDTKKLSLTVESAINSRLASATKDLNLQVLKNKYLSTKDKDKYVVCTDAKADTGIANYKTNKKGRCKIPAIGTGTVTVSAPGCISRTFTDEKLKKNTTIHLQKTNKDGPVISGVWIGDTDVLYSDYALSMVSRETVTLELEIDWGTSSYGSVKLLQKQHTAEFSGDSLTTIISDNFNTGETIYIVATDADGRTTKKSLNFQNGEADKVLNNYSGLSFTTTGKINLKVPENFKPDLLAGQEFGVSLSGVDNMVPVTLTAEDGKVYFSIGVVLNSGSYSEKTQDGETKTKLEQKRFIKEFKNKNLLDVKDAKDGLKKLKSLKKNWGKQIESPEGKFGIDADVTILGFAEGTYDQNGNITWLGSGLIAAPSVSVSKSWPHVLMAGPVPIPYFFEVEFTGEAYAQLNLFFKEAAKNFIPNGTVSGKLALAGSAGLGIQKVAYVQGGLEGALKPTWDIVLTGTDYFKIAATLSAFAKGGIGPFTGKWESDPLIEKTLVEYPDPLKRKIASLLGGLNGDMYDSGSYHLKDLSYLTEASTFNNGAGGAKKAKTLRAGNSPSSSMVLKTNVYKESIPQIVTFSDGTSLAVWMDGTTDDMNKEYLYYSTCENGVWSDPQIVLQDGTMDYSPGLTVIGDTAYIAWQNATQDFAASSDLTLEDIGEYFDISVGTFNKEANSFDVETISNPHLDNTPVVCGNEEAIYVAWVNNSENSWFGDNNKNSIVYSMMDGGTWTEPSTLYDGLMSIHGFDADYDGQLNVAYGMDTDANIHTGDDIRVYENGEQVSPDVLSTVPSYYDHELYWYSNNNIVSVRTSEKTAELPISQYQLLSISGRKAMLYVTGEGLGSKLMVSYYNTETESWGKGIALTDGSDFVGSFSATGDSDHLTILANRSEITGTLEDTGEDPYGASNLWILNSDPTYDLSLGEVSYPEFSFCEGEDMSFDVPVTNEGSASVAGAVLEIRDTDNNVLGTRDIEETIVPGDTAEVSVTYTVPEGVQSQDLVFAVTMPENIVDEDESNNTQSVTLSYEEAFVENAGYGYSEDGTAVIFADVVNRGYHDREGLKVSLVRAPESDEAEFDLRTAEAIETQAADTIAPLESFSAEFELNVEQNDAFYIVLRDTDDVVIDSELVAIFEGFEQHEHEADGAGTVTKEPTKDEEGEMTYTCSSCGETYVQKIPVLEEEQVTAYSDLDDAIASVEEAQKTAESINSGSTAQELAAAEAQISDSIDLAQAAEKAAENILDKYEEGSDAASYAQSKVDQAKENTAKALTANATVKTVIADIAADAALDALQKAEAAASNPGAAAVNAAKAAENAARDYVEKATLAKEAATAAMDAAIAAGCDPDSDTYKTALEQKRAATDMSLDAGRQLSRATEAVKAAEAANKKAGEAAKEKVDLPAVKITKVAAAKKAATVKWKKVSSKNQKKIAKIQIQYSLDKSFKTGVKTTTAKKSAVSKKIKKLTSKKKYYFRIRAYKSSGGVVHVSKWSKTKSAKIK